MVIWSGNYMYVPDILEGLETRARDELIQVRSETSELGVQRSIHVHAHLRHHHMHSLTPCCTLQVITAITSP